jgi:hypothetical protein
MRFCNFFSHGSLMLVVPWKTSLPTTCPTHYQRFRQVTVSLGLYCRSGSGVERFTFRSYSLLLELPDGHQQPTMIAKVRGTLKCARDCSRLFSALPPGRAMESSQSTRQQSCSPLLLKLARGTGPTSARGRPQPPSNGPEPRAAARRARSCVRRSKV